MEGGSMDFIRQQLTIVQERLSGLTPSQKMLTAALVVIMIMTLLYWGRFASDRDMIAILPNALQGEELTKVTNALQAKGISFDATGGMVKVAFDRQADAISALAFNEALPSMSVNAFDTMLSNITPLMGSKEFDARMKSGKEARMAQGIARWPGVKSAIVVITEAERGALVRAEPRVSIDIMTKDGADKGKLAKAAQTWILGGVSGLERERISVTVDTTPVLSGGSVVGDFGSGTFLELKAKFEADESARLRALFSDIQGLYVTVTAEVDQKTTSENIHVVDPTNKISMLKNETMEKSETTEPTSNEPGTISNVAVTANGPAAPTAGSKTESNSTTNDVDWGKTVRVVNTPAGACKVVAANLRVPWSHFRMAYKGRNRKADPTDEELAAFADREMVSLRTQVKSTMQITDETRVTVAEYFDSDSLLDPNQPVMTAGTGSGVMSLATGHAKEVAIGALALTSLFMVSRMVKKSAPASAQSPLTLDELPNLTTGRKRGAKGTNPLDGGVDIAGEVMEGGSIMMGQELDDEVLETSQMVEQVSGFVKDNPDTAAQLVRRWMNRE
jgi:flagellar biosynthesis/type III secretory pathway M-ring protein FliF/YscJ